MLKKQNESPVNSGFNKIGNQCIALSNLPAISFEKTTLINHFKTHAASHSAVVEAITNLRK